MPDEQHSRKQSIPEECSGYPVPVEQYREQGRRHTQYVIISWYNFQHLLHFVMVIRVFVFSGTAWRSITIKGDITHSPRSLKLRAREKISWEVSQVKQDRIVQTEKSIKWQSLCGKLEMICGFRNPPFWMYVFHKLSMWKCCLAYIVINYCASRFSLYSNFPVASLYSEITSENWSQKDRSSSLMLLFYEDRSQKPRSRREARFWLRSPPRSRQRIWDTGGFWEELPY